MTADDVAIRRAADAMVRLDVMVNKMRRDGTLQCQGRQIRVFTGRPRWNGWRRAPTRDDWRASTRNGSRRARAGAQGRQGQ